MALNISMETYLSLITVLIMCIPGIVFFIQIWHKRKVRRTSNLGVHPTRKQRTSMGPSILFYDAMIHPPSAFQYPFRPRERQNLAFERLHSRSRLDVNCAELVGDPLYQPTEILFTDIFMQDSTAISLPQSAYVRHELGRC